MRNFLKSEKGSVMLEFCLVLPIYLLIFGGTFLLFDLSMARLHLQEANRNIAWIQDDRFDAQGLINQKLYQKVIEYYDVRNMLEKRMSDEPIWGFGKSYAKYQEQRQNAESDGLGYEGKYPWGFSLDAFEENGVVLNINQPWADKLGGIAGKRLDNGFMTMHTGNMELSMDKVSATYIGAVGVSSVLFPAAHNGRETVPLYKAVYVLTRARYDDESGNEKEHETTRANGEMLLIRRTDEGEKRENARTVNDLSPLSFGSETPNILFGSWPSNGLIGDISVLLGVGL